MKTLSLHINHTQIDMSYTYNTIQYNTIQYNTNTDFPDTSRFILLPRLLLSVVVRPTVTPFVVDFMVGLFINILVEEQLFVCVWQIEVVAIDNNSA